jgi:acyl-CoA synthetase (NDP forming)
LSVAAFSEGTRKKLSEFLPSMASVGNPVDMVASAGADEYRRCIEVALAAEEIDALIVIYTPVDAFRSLDVLSGIRDGVLVSRTNGAARKPVLACLMAEAGRPHPIETGAERIPAYSFPENAARALGKMARYAAWRAQPPGLSWGFNDIRPEDAQLVCRDVLDRRGGGWLNPEEVGRVLTAFGLPVAPSSIARSAGEAAALAALFGFPVAAKLTARTLVHKSDVGGVRLNLSSPHSVEAAFTDLMTQATERGLTGVDGVLIQPMIAGTELIVGMVEDPHFGPIIGVGLGGTEVELLGDMHFRLAPLTDRDVQDLFTEMRGFPLLDGYRGRLRADVDALSEVVLRVSRLAEEIPEIVELDLNPVMVLPIQQGCRIVDARIKVNGRPPS